MTVFFIGPVPPPVNGFSAMNLAMYDKLRQRTETVLINRAPQAGTGLKGKLNRVFGTLRQLASFHFALRRARHRVVYMGLSGGWGQAFDAAFCLLARTAGARFFFHHHSFAYINHPSRLTRWVFACSGPAQHIVLCACMGDKLAAAYGLPAASLHALSNAALVPQETDTTDNEPSQTRATEAAPVIGFLSNITAEKGIFHFFDALAALRREGVPHTAVIAGPVDGAIQAEFARRLKDAPQAKHMGPVYGISKTNFYRAIDLLFFPTEYANEAEPVTLLEAQQHGVAVLAAQRGCIADVVPAHAGDVVPIEQFGAAALGFVRQHAGQGKTSRAALRAAIQESYAARLENERAGLAALLEQMCRHP